METQLCLTAIVFVMALIRPFTVSSEVTREDVQSLTCSRLLLDNFITSNLNCVSPKVSTERVTNQDQKQKRAKKYENRTKPNQNVPEEIPFIIILML